MKIKGSLGVTLPTDIQYQMIRIDVGAEKEVKPESVEESYDKLFKELEAQLEKRVVKLLEGWGK